MDTVRGRRRRCKILHFFIPMAYARETVALIASYAQKQPFKNRYCV